jgi:hyperosmotically inducible periplasmic protein
MNKHTLASICIVSCVLMWGAASAQGQTSGVSASVSSKASNRALTKSVRKTLARVKGLDPTRIYVKAVDGIVTLSGNVRDQAQVDLAGKTAASVEGVSSVSNRITIFNTGGN